MSGFAGSSAGPSTGSGRTGVRKGVRTVPLGLSLSKPQLALLLSLPLLACTRPVVDGSLGELIDLHYDYAELSIDPPVDFSLPYEQRLAQLSQAAIRYKAAHGDPTITDDDDIIFQVTASYAGVEYLPDTVLELGEYYNGNQRGQVSRNVMDEPGYSFPALERGTFALAPPRGEGVPWRGTFSVTFQNGTAFASGRTVFQNFEARLAQ